MSTVRQFRVLYRHFLFRLMESESLSRSAQGDSNVLLGQLGALLIFGSVLLSWGAISVGNAIMRGGRVGAIWSAERFLISLTMFAVGVFALVNWDAALPDRRDVLTLGPLPVRLRALLAAKIAAAASALGLTVAALHCLAAFAWPLVLAPAGAGLTGMMRFVAAFWVTVTAAGAFLYCVVLGAQAAAAQLPRRWYLRTSPLLQIGLFALFLGGLCFQPDWLPTDWFTGLLCELSGYYSDEATASLARRAVIGLAAAISTAGGAFLLSYLRTLRKIVEEPDAASGRRGGVPLPRFGHGPQTAIAHFVIRTLTRSRQHRVILSFYLGGGFALTVLYLGIMSDVMRLTGEDLLHRVNTPMLVASVILLCAAWLGARTVFSLPVELRANWLFRVTPAPDGRSTRTATRRALLAVSALPVTAIVTAVLCWFWPWTAATGHAIVLGSTGCILVDVSLNGFGKIPFTCSYLPGKSKAHLVFWFGIIPAIFAIHKLVGLEIRAMANPPGYAGMLIGLGAIALTVRQFGEPAREIQFEETSADELVGLGLGGL